MKALEANGFKKERTSEAIQKAELAQSIRTASRESNRNDGMDFSDAILLATLAYMWLGDNDPGNHYGESSILSDDTYGNSSSDGNNSRDYPSSPVVSSESDYGSSSSDYSSSSPDYSSSSPDYSSSSSDYSSSSSDYSSSSSDYSSSSSYD